MRVSVCVCLPGQLRAVGVVVVGGKPCMCVCAVDRSTVVGVSVTPFILNPLDCRHVCVCVCALVCVPR